MSIRISTKVKIPRTGIIRGAGPLNVPMIKQEQRNWCWAACADMILHYYGNPGITQCQLANWAFGQSSCCQIPSSTLCDNGIGDAKISQLFSVYGLRSSYTANYVAYGILDIEIGSRRPVEVGYTWNGGGGHVAVVIETTVISGRQVVSVNDPGYGPGSVYYPDLLTAYGLGRWDATWTGIQR